MNYFVNILESNQKKLSKKIHSEIAGELLEEIGYCDMLKDDKTYESEGRLENLKKLVSDINNRNSLGDFLEEVSLVIDNSSEVNEKKKISLMTLHSAKGLEFDTVLLPGWEEGIFPNQRNIDEYGNNGLEEERRLAYVGITRARNSLSIFFANYRKQYNQSLYRTIPSRFLSELPKKSCDLKIEDKMEEKYPRVLESIKSEKFKVGDKVLHENLGEGTVLGISNDKVQITFQKTKEVVKVFADYLKKVKLNIMVDYLKRLSALKKLCKEKKFDSYILSTRDEYLNEYAPIHKQRLKWLTGFSGSNGLLLYYKDLFIFFTDGRYTLQATSELPSLIKIYDTSKYTIFDFLSDNRAKKIKLCVDSKIHSITFIKNLIRVTEKNKIKIHFNSGILIDQLYKFKSNQSFKQAFLLSNKYTGYSAKKKINLVKNKIKNLYCYIITAPESVSWLLNLRGYDLQFTPVVMSRMIFYNSKKIVLYIEKNKLPERLNTFLNKLGITISSEDQIHKDLKKIDKKKMS